MAEVRICSIEGCSNIHYGQGYCSPHYQRWRRHGDPLGGNRNRGEAQRYYEEVVLPYKGDDCLKWPYNTHKNGYGFISRKNKIRSVHIYVCMSVYGPRPSKKHVVAHSCGNGTKGCVNPNHLRWATYKENSADTLLHGRSNRGQRCGTNKLTESQVREIRALLGTMSQYAIAERYGVSRGCILAIHRRDNWFWLE